VPPPENRSHRIAPIKPPWEPYTRPLVLTVAPAMCSSSKARGVFAVSDDGSRFAEHVNSLKLRPLHPQFLRVESSPDTEIATIEDLRLHTI
jgi:hypothetical protein